VLFHHGLNELAGLSNVYLATYTMNAVYTWVLQCQIVLHTVAEAGDLLGWQTMSFSFASFIILFSGMDSIVGIATHYGLTKNQIPVEGRFSVPVQTVPDTHQAYCTSGTRFFLDVKQPERGADHASPSRAKVVSGLELYLFLPSVPA